MNPLTTQKRERCLKGVKPYKAYNSHLQRISMASDTGSLSGSLLGTL